jgi:hypothetical protein
VLRHKNLIGILSLALYGSSCGGGPAAGGGSSIDGLISEFKGLKSLEKTSDTSWALRWNPIPADGIVYAVFAADEGESFNFNSPLDTSMIDIYQFQAKDLYTKPSQCFIVRIANYLGDSNQESLCTHHEQLKFTGATSIDRQSDGTYLVHWDKLPLSDAIYAVYESKDGAPFNFNLPSYDGVKVNFLKTELFERESQYCFIVRYYHADLPADQNSAEVCTQLEEGLSFTGVSSIEVLSSTSLKIHWLNEGKAGIESYKIYQGSDFKELVGKEPKTSDVSEVSGLVSGRQYSFGVKAVDTFGREDKNLRILSIVMP